MPRLARALAVAVPPHRDRFVYVPFNEPDWIWYGLNASDPAAYAAHRDRFLRDWSTVYHRIRALDPGARIAGPNEAFYDRRFMPDFLRYAQANDVMPDVVTWHELPTNQLKVYRGDYADYRALERDLGIPPRPLNINEWGGRRDLSVPGRLVQWISMFEDTKVDAGGQAYWDAAGNLSDNATQTNRPTGSWWLFKMYADMTGETVSATPPVRNVVDTFQGLAAIDDDKRQAHIVLGGQSGDLDVAVAGVDRALFGDRVRVTVSRTDWSGYDADAPPPVVIADTDYRVHDGRITIPLRGLDRMAAYELVLAPGGAGRLAAVRLPWRARYEAEDARVVDGRVYTQGTPENFNGYAASGDKDIGSLNQPGSAVTFAVDVPHAGRYRLSILYGNQTGTVSQQVLRVDGADPRFVPYPATLNWTFRARADVDLELAAGAHALTLAKSDPALGTAKGEATLDRVDLELLPPDGRPAPVAYEAERSQTSGDVRYRYDERGQSGAGYIVAEPGSQATFVVAVPADGYYDLALRHSGAGRATLSYDAQPLEGAVLRPRSDWGLTTERLYLSAGVHRIGVHPGGPVSLDVLTATAAPPGGVQSIEAEAASNELAGAATVRPNAYASGGAQVVGVGNGAGNTLTLRGVTAPRAGQYVLVIHYANDERAGEHQYNANIVSRATDIAVDDGPAQRVWLRNTWSWDNFWSVGVPIRLRAGVNSIRLSNDAGPAPSFDRFEIAALRAAAG